MSNLSKEDALNKIANWDIDNKLKAAAINGAEFSQEGANLSRSFTGASQLSNIFTGIGASIKPLIPAIAAIGAGFAALSESTS